MAADHQKQQQQSLCASLLRQLECPVCLDTCTAPIYQCANGHHLCATCRKRLTCCGVCRAPLATTRNRFAEDIASQLATLQISPAEDPPDATVYRCYCLLAVPPYQCTWEGTCDAIFAHVADAHAGSATCGDTVDLSIDLPCFDDHHDMLYPRLLSHDGYLFWGMIYCARAEGRMHIYARRVGAAREGEQEFVCEFSLVGGENKLVYTRKPLRQSEAFREPNKALGLTADMINMFSSGGRVKCIMKIVRERGEKGTESRRERWRSRGKGRGRGKDRGREGTGSEGGGQQLIPLAKGASGGNI